MACTIEILALHLHNNRVIQIIYSIVSYSQNNSVTPKHIRSWQQ